MQTIEEKILQIHRTIAKLEESNAEEVTFSENGVETVIPRNVLIAKLFKKEDSFLSEKTKTRKNSEETQMRLSNKNKEIEMWEKRYAEAKAALQKALQAAPRHGRETADAGRRKEIATLLVDVNKKLD